MSPDPELVERLERYGQGHLLAWWSDLTDAGRARLQAEIAAIDFEQLNGLIGELIGGEPAAAIEPARVQPIEVIRQPQTDGQRVARRRVMELGAEALAAGEVGVILVA